jgi:multidrug efflux pump subunit AcrA (membrane-fusion protein)
MTSASQFRPLIAGRFHIARTRLRDATFSLPFASCGCRELFAPSDRDVVVAWTICGRVLRIFDAANPAGLASGKHAQSFPFAIGSGKVSEILTTSSGSEKARPESAVASHEFETDLHPRPRGGRPTIGNTVLGWIPSTLVVAGLAGLAWFGHHNEWKLPKFGASTGISDISRVDWCDSHGVPESECLNCVPGFIEEAPEIEFCQEHGVHGCVFHDPSLAQTKEPAEVSPQDLQRALRALAIRPRRENLALSQRPGSRIQFASIGAMQKAGVDVEPVERRSVTETVPTAGEVLYDATKTAQASPAADGIVRQVNVNVGDWVQAGQVLAVVDSEKVGQLKSQLLSALSDENLKRATVDRIDPVIQSGAIPAKRQLEVRTELQQATVAVDLAVRALGNLGLRVDMKQLRSLGPEPMRAAIRKLGMEKITGMEASDNLIAVVAPLEGRVVNRETVVGEVVDRGSAMFRISDTRSVWLDLRVPAEEASLAKIGLQVRYRPDGSETVHRGRIIWISSDLNSQTRTVRVRAELTNADGGLRNESFGLGEIILRDESDAIVAPDSSIQWDGENTMVFVRDARFFEKGRPKFFVARSVRVGVSDDGFTEIIAGVLPGEVVATSGSDVLRAQLLKGNLGAGCTCGQ